VWRATEEEQEKLFAPAGLERMFSTDAKKLKYLTDFTNSSTREISGYSPDDVPAMPTARFHGS
jgi:hypothetical protein